MVFHDFHAGNWHPLTWISHMADFETTSWTPVVIIGRAC